jgi:hypothetical protein
MVGTALRRLPSRETNADRRGRPYPTAVATAWTVLGGLIVVDGSRERLAVLPESPAVVPAFVWTFGPAVALPSR